MNSLETIATAPDAEPADIEPIGPTAADDAWHLERAVRELESARWSAHFDDVDPDSYKALGRDPLRP